MNASSAKYDLTQSVRALGWSESIRHLAGLAREEGFREIGATLAVISDVLDADLQTSAEQLLGVLWPDDEALDLADAHLDGQYPRA